MFINSKQIELKSLAGASFKTLQDLQNTYHSVGHIAGGILTDNGDETISVSSGSGAIRAVNNNLSPLLFTDWSEALNLTLTDESNNFIYVNYNNGSPNITVSTIEFPYDHTQILLGSVYRGHGELHLNPTIRPVINDHAGQMILFNKAIMPYIRESGAAVLDKTARKFSLSSGAFWEGLTRFTTPAFDTSGSTTFEYWHHVSGDWTSVPLSNQINNTQYDNGTDLVSLTAGYYAVHFIYVTVSGELLVVWSCDQFPTLALAQNHIECPLPPLVEAQGILVAYAIVQEGNNEFVELQNIFGHAASGIAAGSHNNLTGLQGGTAGEYFHLTADQYANLTNTIDTASNVNTTGFGVFKQRTGSNLEFRGINATSSKLSVSLNGTTNSIDLDVNQGNLSLGSIGGSLNLATQVDSSILPIANGGTNSSTAAGALTNLGAVAKAGDSMSGLLTLNAGATVPTGQKITLIDQPTSSTDAANKAYVDAVAQGLDVKNSVRAISTSNITLSGTQTVDGVSLISGDRILVAGQTTGSQNGIYVVASGSWSRATDADSSSKVTAGLFTFIEEGTSFGDSGWVLTTNQPIILGTTSLTFTQFTGAGQITAGAGLTKTGNTLDVVSSNTGITVNADDIALTLKTSSGLQISSGLGLKLNSAAGLVSNAGAGTDELKINLATSNPGLQITSNQLDTKLVSNGGIVTGTNGLSVDLSASSISGTVAINHGGTGQTTAIAAFNALSPLTTQGDLLYFDGINNVRLAKNTSSTRYLSNTGTSNNPAWAQIDLTSGVTGILPVGNGGIGISTTPSNGQIPIGNGTNYTAAAITAGVGITITNAAGSITISSADSNEVLSTGFVQTTNATATTIQTISTTTNSVMLIETKVTGYRTGGTAGATGDSVTMIVTSRIKNIAGTVTINNTQNSFTSRDQGAYNVTLATSGTNILVQVTGANNNNIDWNSSTRVQVTS